MLIHAMQGTLENLRELRSAKTNPKKRKQTMKRKILMTFNDILKEEKQK